ncbi:condensin subunit ScpB [Nitrosomonas marina]|uniref:Condensin subunit ScpB n=1 Tax=Nitrosomonas marina TaxID=917 RepID=A0A1H9Z3Q6_9PROT|nr:condensin subunit ScpB [Nitrosomonas marina]
MSDRPIQFNRSDPDDGKPVVSASNALMPQQIKQVIETALLAAQEPLSTAMLRKLFDSQVESKQISSYLEEIRKDWTDKGIELVRVASGWRFQVKAEMQPFLNRLNPPKTPRYSRAVMETLAIIAYYQPVTRGDIEEIRGISVSSSILKTLTARGWVDQVGHRNVPGKPALLATTQQFLNDLGIRALEELPPLEELGTLIDTEVNGIEESEVESSTNE